MAEDETKKPRPRPNLGDSHIPGQYIRNPNPSGVPFKTPGSGEKIDAKSLRLMEDLKNPDTQDRTIKNTVSIAANMLGDEAVKKALADGTFSEMLKNVKKELGEQNKNISAAAKEAGEFLKDKDPKALEKTRETNDEATNKALDALKANKSHQDKMVYVGNYRHMEHKGVSGLSQEELQQKSAEAFEKLPPRKIKEITVTDKEVEDLYNKDPNDLSPQELKIVLDRKKGLTIEKTGILQELMIEKGGGVDPKKENAVKGAPQKGMVEDREIDPIKEDDIINYMYNEWILKFANYSVKKGFRGIDELIDMAERHIVFGNRNLDKNVNHQTPTLLKKFDKIYKDDVAVNKRTKYDGKNWRKTSEAVYNGKFDKLPISEESFEFVKAMSEEDRKKYFNPTRAEASIEVLDKINERFLNIAATYAAAQIYNKQATGQLNMKENDTLKKLYKQEKAAAQKNLYKWLDQYSKGHPLNDQTTENMYAELQDMTKNAQDGYVESSNQVANGKYKDNNDPNNAYKPPEALQKLENKFSSLEQGKIGLYEAALGERDAQAFLDFATRSEDKEFKNHEGQKISLDNRKERDYNKIERICEKNGFPKRPVKEPEPGANNNPKFDFTIPLDHRGDRS